MARKIRYKVRLRLAGGAILTNKIIEAKDLVDLGKRVHKLYGQDTLMLQWIEI
jgi:hypothetical protein